MSDRKMKVVVALGYFDSVHIGHQKVMKTARIKAQELGANFCVVTFGGNLKSALGYSQEKNVYNQEDRQDLINEQGANQIFFAPTTKEFLSLIDVLVDGRFVEELKSLALRFRGSSNQRLIDMKKTLEKGEIVMWEDEPINF